MFQQEEQQMRTQFQFRNAEEQQNREFEHRMLDSQQFQREMENARTREEGIQAIRAQLMGETLPVQQVRQTLRPAQRQGDEPKAAPQEAGWKERRAKKKQQERALKQGRKLTEYADALTAELVEQQKVNAKTRRFVDHKCGGELMTKELLNVLESLDGVRLSADQFTDENFVSQYDTLRDLMEKSAFISRAANDVGLMEQIRGMSSSLYASALYWQKTAPALREMFRLANNAHALDENGQVLKDVTSIVEDEDGVEQVVTNVVSHAKYSFNMKLTDFRKNQSRRDQEYQQQLAQELQQEYEQTLGRKKRTAAGGPPEAEQAWMTSPSLKYGDPTSYYELQELKRMIEENRAVYEGDQKIVDRMYSETIRRYELLGELSVRRQAWEEIRGKYVARRAAPGTDTARYIESAERELERIERDREAVEKMMISVRDALGRLVTNDTISTLEAAVLMSYGYKTEDNLLEQATARARRTRWQKDILDQLAAEEGLTATEMADPYVAEAASLFRRNDREYNRMILTRMRRFSEENARQWPVRQDVPEGESFKEKKWQFAAARKPYYDELCQMVEPIVNRVMEWDAERYLNMSDEELVAEQENLDELYGSTMCIVDVMKMTHPNSGKFTMMDDVLGDRQREFSHRANALRWMTEKSRGLAMQALAQLGIPGEACLTEKERQDKIPLLSKKLGLEENSPEMFKAIAEQQIALGGRFLKAEKQKWAAERDANSKEFRQVCADLPLKHNSSEKVFERDSQLTEVERRYERILENPPPDTTEEELAIVERTMSERYHCCGWEMADARVWALERGRDLNTLRDDQLSENIQESLFRGFGNFNDSAGAKSLTAEEFQQMLRELSAGADLSWENATPRQIFEAQDQNRRGCLRHKETLRVTYDYLARKYGFGLEKVPVMELTDHWEEILRDLGRLQTDSHFIEFIPDILDMDDPEDARLYHQICYMNIMGKTVQDIPALVGWDKFSQSDIAGHIQRALNDEINTVPHLKALLAMEDHGDMTDVVKWGDEVQAKERRPLPDETPEAVEQRWQRFQQRMAPRAREEKLYLLEQWVDKDVRYPTRYTERLYTARNKEHKGTQAREKVVSETIKARRKKNDRITAKQEEVFASVLPHYDYDKNDELSAEDAALVQKMTEDYFFGSQEQRNDALDYIVGSLCETQFSPEMFTLTYFRNHMLEMRILARRLNNLGPLMRENEAYFKSLPRETQALVRSVSQFAAQVDEWTNVTLENSGLGRQVGVEVQMDPVPEEAILRRQEEERGRVQRQVKQWGRAREGYLRKMGRAEV